MRTRADSPTKFCTVDGCNGALRARGMCSTHYNNVHYPDRHSPVPTPCVVCGTVVLRGVKNDRRHVCSVECRAVLAGHIEGGSPYRWAIYAATRARTQGARVVEVFDAFEVFARDRLVCYLCGSACNPHAAFDTPLAPTVDHVIPLSRGGDHSLENCRTACLRCNSSKQDRDPKDMTGKELVASRP